MCGRFTLTVDIEELQEAFPGVDFGLYMKPSYNIAPSQSILSISNATPQKAQLFHWGLIPPWSKDKKIAYKMINARSETLADKPSFKSPFRSKRCLILADGFYEWKKEGDKKIPTYIRLKSKKPFAFAGLWETWNQEKNQPIHSCTIITTEANPLLKPVHHRMLVILKKTDYDLWLDPTAVKPETLQHLLEPYDSNELEYFPVSTVVNSPRNNSPECVVPASA